MNDDFKPTVGKRMPYAETDEYIDSLVTRCADRAIALRDGSRGSHRRSGSFMRRMGIAATSMAAAILAAAIIIPSAIDDSGSRITAATIAQSSSLSDVLSSLSNDELATLDYYTLEDLPDDYDEQ